MGRFRYEHAQEQRRRKPRIRNRRVERAGDQFNILFEQLLSRMEKEYEASDHYQDHTFDYYEKEILTTLNHMETAVTTLNTMHRRLFMRLRWENFAPAFHPISPRFSPHSDSIPIPRPYLQVGQPGDLIPGLLMSVPSRSRSRSPRRFRRSRERSEYSFYDYQPYAGEGVPQPITITIPVSTLTICTMVLLLTDRHPSQGPLRYSLT